MELLIAGAVLFAGYRMTESRGGGREPRERPAYARLPGSGNALDEPGMNTGPADRDLERRAAMAMAASRDPGATGMVTSSTLSSTRPSTMSSTMSSTMTPNPPMPFFRSARTQHTDERDDGVKQRRLEMFTGANSFDTSLTGTYRHKREIPAMFDPRYTAQAVTSSGSAGNAPMTRDRGRLEAGVMRTNELPTEQIRVGPGVGVGPDVLATDGLHSMYRSMPCNVNAYRLNPLPGGVVIGAPRVSKGPGTAGKFRARPRTGATAGRNRRDPLPTSSATTGHRVYPRVLVKSKPHNVVVEDRMGNPGMRGPHAGVGCGLLAHTHKDKRQLDARMPWLNLAGPNGAGQRAKLYMRPQRREAHGRLGVAAGPEARRVDGQHVARHTQRESTDVMPWGGIGVVRSTGAVRVLDAKPTLREGAEAPPLLGAVAAVKGGSMNNVYRQERPLRFTKRSVQQHIGSGFYDGRKPQASRINRVRPSDAGAVGIRRRDRETARAGMPHVANGAYSPHLGESANPHNKLPSLNPRLGTLSFARDQLRHNPFAMTSVWDQANS